MSAVFFVSDLHLGHRKILHYTREAQDKIPASVYTYRGGATVEEHDEWVIGQLMSVNPNKRTVWYIMGDVAMDESKLPLLDQVPGRKILVLGNHDTFPSEAYLRHFEQLTGGFKKYGFWITHMPIHADELRGKPNLHGHCHNGGPELYSPAYFNAAIEFLPDQRPVSLDWLRKEWLPYVPPEMRG